jgi:hypothetical protein
VQSGCGCGCDSYSCSVGVNPGNSTCVQLGGKYKSRISIFLVGNSLTVERLGSDRDSLTPTDSKYRTSPVKTVEFTERGFRVFPFHERNESTEACIFAPSRSCHISSRTRGGVATRPHDFDLSPSQKRMKSRIVEHTEPTGPQRAKKWPRLCSVT